MNWNQVKPYFSGDLDDLIEVYFEDMTLEKWALLFDWLPDKMISLNNYLGSMSLEELSLDDFCHNNIGYIASIKSSCGLNLDLGLIDPKALTIDFEKRDIQSEIELNKLLETLREIDGVINSGKYIVCPEFKKEQAFIVNGRFVGAARPTINE